MAEFVQPDVQYQQSFLAAVDEIRAAEEDERYTGLSVIMPVGDFPGESFSSDELKDPGRFAAYTERLRELAEPGTWLPDGVVPATHLWWVDGDDFLGRLSIRHSLTPFLLNLGGHIGYVVRPSARGRGAATAMLRAALPVANQLGIDPALVTCDDDNRASSRVIETCGGVFEDQRENKLRYWLATS